MMQVPSSFTRLARLMVIALGGVLMQAAVAFAHASLNTSEPQDGAVVSTAPSVYALTFSEPVSPLSLKLVRPDGTAIPLTRFELKDRVVEIAAPTDLGYGTHVLSWRVTSADGHPIGGSVVFSVGAASTAPLMTEAKIDWAVRAGVLLSKLALYVGLFIGVGGVFSRHWCLCGLRSGRSLVAAALGVGLLGTLAAVGFQGLDALGVSVAQIVEPVVWSTAMATSFGGTAIAAFIAFGVATIAHRAEGRYARLSSLAALIASSVALSLSGHASTAEPQWLMRSAVFLHVATISLWVGALAPLGLALRRKDPMARQALGCFSAFIPYVLVVLIVAGCILAFVQVERPQALVDTAYGQVFMVKLALMVGLFLLALANRWRMTEPVMAGDRASAKWLARSIAAETLIVFLIFGAVSCWRLTPPPRALLALTAEPASVHIHTEKAMALVEVLPGRVGEVDVSINVATGEFAPLAAKEVTLVLTKPDAGIEPFKRAASPRGDADWRIEHMNIPLPGTWQVRVDILISDFERVTLSDQINLGP
ncbi:copper resistance CopC/CopD family protein (plasmid) [Ensifer adhaerens]|uniref:copper resistance CopC/CopD family protein n=1 Tax=Ensifer adhaerens TaxID=106592 RepID=UPI0023AA1018|nr:copper resistance CopC/CopD family protein [Ensifer adhaerens]WDZ80671.1 copper resistance CopC/CopD family protein [Ensifer adhaerens]